MNDINFVENLILVRNEPHIYAFSTNTIPNYLKIGDTFRPVDVRIEEWNKKISEALGSEVEVKLTKEFTKTAVIDDAYFRDYSVHNFLRDSLGKMSIDVTEPDLGYAANDIVLIALWIMATIENISYLSVVVCFVAFFVNDIYGYVSWKKMQIRQAKGM